MARYVVGIDLGTTNCALSFAEPSSVDASVEIQRFDVTQVIAPGVVEAQSTLPSFLLLPTEHEVKPTAMALPWNDAPTAVVGVMARERGAELPQRLVSSAKSWLSHTGVDRKASILPWIGTQNEDDKPKAGGVRLSPVEVSARYLSHLRDAWDAAHPDAPLSAQDIVLTVPASFDAVARELTVTAARQAGLEHLTLLEEPQAAFYSWLARYEHGAGDGGAGDGDASDWRDQIRPGDVVLVCDIGGGTTDFSLIEVTDDGAGNLQLERVAVGEHILLGGDNMDLALAHVVMQGLGKKAKKLKAMQKRALVHMCRRAKETLLTEDAPESVPIALLGTGSRLIGGTIRTQVRAEQVHALMKDGFFPSVPADARPQARRAVGLRELGLPYAHDPGVTRHLAAFLARNGRIPTAVLYNGGVMKGTLLRERVADIIGEWFSGNKPRVLTSGSAYLDLAVAHGAAYYGLVRQGKGIRIRGGLARAYYIGVESSMPAIPGFAPPIKCLCVAPFGMEEGASVDLPDEELGLIVGESAEFRFFAASGFRDDTAGTVRDPDDDAADPDDEDDDTGGLVELDPVETMLSVDETRQAGDIVPVTLQAKITEVGTLELWCVARDGSAQWKLEYSVRESEEE